MATETIKGFVHWRPERSYQEARFNWFAWDNMDGYMLVGPHDITFDVPETFNPVAVELAQIEAERKLRSAEFAETMRRIDIRVSKLTAIGHATEVSL